MINKFLFELVIFLNNFSIIIIQLKNYYFIYSIYLSAFPNHVDRKTFWPEKKGKKYIYKCSTSYKKTCKQMSSKTSSTIHTIIIGVNMQMIIVYRSKMEVAAV